MLVKAVFSRWQLGFSSAAGIIDELPQQGGAIQF
jgi:hypothetical protein